MAYSSPAFATHFVATKTAEQIASRLREDEALVNAGEPCSWAAWYLPVYKSDEGRAIGAQLAPLPDLSHDIKQLLYDNLLSKIRTYLDNDGSMEMSSATVQSQEQSQRHLPRSELDTALKVLLHLQDCAIVQPNTPAEVIISWLKGEVSPDKPEDSSASQPDVTVTPRIQRKRHCYICRLAITESYPTHPSMCIPCGTFNSASSLISTPPTLQLPSEFVALVTGARINLGYHTTLRLLRCGASVIATTRYPRDAVVRYLKEPDSNIWCKRLKVIGADFRSAADAFALARETKTCLEDWAGGREPVLNALINNAAQTLTDSIKKEQRAIQHESTLKDDNFDQSLLIEGTYMARVRGGATPLLLNSIKPNMNSIKGPDYATEPDFEGTGIGVTSTTELEPYSKSSWVQSLFDIPYEDVMSAHAVNTFVPLILIRELLPLMGCTNTNSSTKPSAYIINVSSREGIFEDRLRANAKKGHHVHTNMSKAALNMITETEAATAWKSRRVAMNTVDPGYMSAAPEYEDAFDGTRPIGWEDGAGRVLWPLAIGEVENRAIWGRFLKHYGAVEVKPGLGRG